MVMGPRQAPVAAAIFIADCDTVHGHLVRFRKVRRVSLLGLHRLGRISLGTL